MRTLLELFAQAADNPAFWPVAFAIPVAAVLLAGRWLKPVGLVMRQQAAVLAVVSAVLIAGYVMVCWRYLLMPSYADHVQPTVASISWYFWTGKPVYHSMASIERYNLPYGPYLFVINGLTEGLAGPSILSSKVAGVFAAIVALALVFATIKRQASGLATTIVVGIYAALLLHFRTYSFWSRPEPFLVLFVALGLHAAVARFRLAAVVFGIAVGICMNLKIHSLVYFIPVFALAIETKPSRRDVVIAAACAFVVFVAPFVVFRNISLSGYLSILRLTSAHGFDMWQYRRVVEWLGAMLVPAVGLLLLSHFRDAERTKAVLRENALPVAALFVGAALLVVPASKYGAGPHHWMPFLPVIALLTTRLVAGAAPLSWSGTPAQVAIYPFVGSWIICAFVGGFLTISENAKRYSPENRAAAHQVVDDLQSIIARDGATHVLLAGTGSSATYDAAYLRPLLTFAGMPIGVDPAALMDFKRGKVPTPDFMQVVGDLATQRQPLWVVPRDSLPFTMETFYPPQDALYDSAFRQKFTALFERSERTPHFDLYARRP